MFTIGQLCREYGLSRSTLLYYDSIGLLKPSARSASNYRLFTEEDKARLERICLFRDAGVPLLRIKEILNQKEEQEDAILAARLEEINKDIRLKRLQQKLIISMLKNRGDEEAGLLTDEPTFSAILKSAGLDEETMKNLHIQYEKNSPQAHQFFLEFLGLPDEMITRIRERSKENT